MAYDGNGNFLRVHNWVQDAANSIDISAPEMDAEDNGFAGGLSNAVTRDGQGKMAVDFVPNSDNTLNLGGATARWKTLNGVNISTLPVTQSAIGAIFQPQSAAESAASVTPTNFFYAVGNINRYGNNNVPGTTDMTTALNNALLVASKSNANIGGAAVYLPAGIYAFSSDINMPMGDPYLLGGGAYAVSMYGDGREQTILKAISGGSFTHGIYFNGVSGPSYRNMGTLRDLQIDGNALLVDGITTSFCQLGTIERVGVRNCTHRGLFHDNCLMMRYKDMFVTLCGSASFSQIEIDGSLTGSTGGTTTTILDHVWVQSGNSGCVAGMAIDRSYNVTVINGAYESTGQGIQISSKSTTFGCNGIKIINTDFEVPTIAYISAGFGLSSTNYVTALTVENCTGEAPGATAQAIIIQQCNGARFTNNNWIIGGSYTSSFNLFGTSNINTVIDPHPSMNNPGSTIPHVIVNGSQVRTASPLVQFNQNAQPSAPLPGNKSVALASSWSPWAQGNNPNQGGWFSTLIASNSGGITVLTMAGDSNMVINIIGDGFTTLTQGTSGNAFDNISGANFLLVANHFYQYRYDSARGCWRQLGTA